MTTTTSIATWVSLHHGSQGLTPEDMIRTASLGDYADDHDLPGLTAAYRAAVGAVLPEGVHLVGDELLAPVGPSYDLDAIREAVEAVDVFALADVFVLPEGDKPRGPRWNLG